MLKEIRGLGNCHARKHGGRRGAREHVPEAQAFAGFHAFEAVYRRLLPRAQQGPWGVRATPGGGAGAPGARWRLPAGESVDLSLGCLALQVEAAVGLRSPGPPFAWRPPAPGASQETLGGNGKESSYACPGGDGGGEGGRTGGGACSPGLPLPLRVGRAPPFTQSGSGLRKDRLASRRCLLRVKGRNTGWGGSCRGRSPAQK